jgi:outer membrane protein OmpU
MKHTLLATTALVAMTGAAAAEITVSGTGRIGVRSTEGAAAVAAKAPVHGSLTAKQAASYAALVGKTTTTVALATTTSAVAATAGFVATETVKVANAITGATTDLTAATLAYTNAVALGTSTDAAIATALTNVTKHANDLATLQAISAAMAGTGAVAAVKKAADTTTAVNRFRISFAGSGETDSGISYGISGRAEQSNSAVAGSQYISGAFGKIKMGDLGGADKDAAGHIAGGVGLSGMGSNNEIAYQAATHNLGYEFSTNGLTFGYSQNTAVQTGSNSALGIKWAGDMGGAGITLGVGQSKLGTATQSTMSIAMSMGGLTVKAISSTNDNGPAASITETAGSEGVAYIAGVSAPNHDTDHTGFSIAYAMDAMSLTAYSKTVSTSGVADKDYTGLGFTYDMGGATLKAGMVEDDGISSMDLGVSFSF